MREIRFRAFDAKSKEMLSHDWLIGANIFYSAIAEQPRKDVHIMQFTGIKDINGKDIYESDICLKHWSKDVYGDRKPTKGVIKWVLFGGRFTHESIEENKIYCELHENLTIKEYPRSLFEIIGNIYENPELLKETI